ncbi:MAG TPA: radical SAM protein [Candidatus Dormibacteraeota bacterium]|nr:radical SAM protein [Candidatus Dormibacteraeota bacterium]
MTTPPATPAGLRRPPTDLIETTCRTALQPVRGMWFEWSLNPYGGCVHRCTFCYVRAFERRADRPSDDRYGRAVRVKTNVVTVLRDELRRPSHRSGLVCLGTATDPYQPAEGRYRLTRGCLEALAAARRPLTLTTRGPLVVRDAALLAEADAAAGVSVSISLPTVDEAVVRRTEPGTAPPRQRLRALERLAGAGVRAGVLMAPVLPGISDGEASMAATVRAARDAGAAFLLAGVLHLTPGTREHFLAALASDWPELLPRYLDLYRGRSHLPAALTSPVATRAARLRAAAGISADRPPRPQLPPAPSQLRLAI